MALSIIYLATVFKEVVDVARYSIQDISIIYQLLKAAVAYIDAPNY